MDVGIPRGADGKVVFSETEIFTGGKKVFITSSLMSRAADMKIHLRPISSVLFAEHDRRVVKLRFSTHRLFNSSRRITSNKIMHRKVFFKCTSMFVHSFPTIYAKYFSKLCKTERNSDGIPRKPVKILHPQHQTNAKIINN